MQVLLTHAVNRTMLAEAPALDEDEGVVEARTGGTSRAWARLLLGMLAKGGDAPASVLPKVFLPNVRYFAFGLLCAAAIGIGPGRADNHPYNLRQVGATTTGVTLKMLLEQCDAAPDDMSANFCTGYIAAAFDQLSLAQRICPPKHLTTKQIFEVGRAYLFGHAMHRDMHPGWLLAEAFREAYGCTPR